MLPKAADGRISFPLREELLEENPVILTSVPEGIKTQVQMDLLPRLPEGTSFSSADLLRAVTQANKLIHAQAGFFAFGAPKLKGIVLRFEGRDEMKFLLDESELEKNPRITLPAPPTGADFIE